MLYRNVQRTAVIMLIATGTIACKTPEDVLAAEIALSTQLMQKVQKKGQQFAQERQKEAATIVHCLTSLQQTTHDTLLDCVSSVPKISKQQR